MEGTYLTWIDVSALLSPEENVQMLCDRIMRETRVWINPGTMYGPQTGEGYIRINIACQRERFMEGLARMATCLETHKN